MMQKFIPINDDLQEKGTVLSVGSTTFKVSDLTDNMTTVIREIGLTETNKKLSSQQKGQLPINRNTLPDAWCTDGVESEILIPGSKGWIKGKVRFKVYVEFCPDESEAIAQADVDPGQMSYPLDDLRQIVTQYELSGEET